MKDSSEKAYKEFLAEAEEHIETLYSNLDVMDSTLKEGKRIDPDVLNSMFRAAHSLKGLAGMFNFETLSSLSHELENLFDQLRLGKRKADQNFTGALYDAVDALKKVLDAGSEDKVSEELKKEAEATIEKAKKVETEEKTEGISLEKAVPERILAVMTEYEEHRLKENLEMGFKVLLLKVIFDIDNFDERLSSLSEIIKKRGEVISTLPSGEDVEPGKIKFELLIGTEEDEKILMEKIKDYNVEIVPLKTKGEEPAPETLKEDKKKEDEKSEVKKKSERVEERYTSHPSQFLRVDIYQLDEVMNTVGELFLVRSSIDRMLENWKRIGRPTEDILEIERIVRNLNRNLNFLRESVMEMRMVPIRSLFDRVVRTVKKITRETGKKIAIDYTGEDTKLDKFIVEELMDPMMHIIRNCIDHGIEEVEERLLAGKSEEGHILMRAYQKGNHVVIEIEDDGRGIDIKEIRKKAIEKGLIGKDEAFSKEEILNFIFLPGFSTKGKVTMISGRGVGLDVVADKVKSLRGFVDVKTEEGKHTRFSITLPMTLAIIQALLVKVGEREFGIPITSVSETIEFSHSIIKTIESKEVLLLREETIPVVNIEKIFNFENNIKPNFVIIAGVGERKVAVPVTDLMGRSDVVIKSLGEVLKGVKGIAGAAEFGDNKIVLILDIVSLLENVMRH